MGVFRRNETLQTVKVTLQIFACDLQTFARKLQTKDCMPIANEKEKSFEVSHNEGK